MGADVKPGARDSAVVLRQCLLPCCSPLQYASVRTASREAGRMMISRTSTKEISVSDSVYRVTEVIGASGESWEAAARNAVQTAAKTIRDLRVAEVLQKDVTIENGDITTFRVRLGISFKYESGE